MDTLNIVQSTRIIFDLTAGMLTEEHTYLKMRLYVITGPYQARILVGN